MYMSGISYEKIRFDMPVLRITNESRTNPPRTVLERIYLERI